MANNTVANIFNAPELKKRLLFLIGALAVFRIAAAIPIPGINADVLKQLFAAHQNGILGFMNIFSGGALGKFSILALGIMPYINASIIINQIFQKIKCVRIFYIKTVCVCSANISCCCQSAT